MDMESLLRGEEIDIAAARMFEEELKRLSNTRLSRNELRKCPTVEGSVT
jgi:hypothetical protein